MGKSNKRKKVGFFLRWKLLLKGKKDGNNEVYKPGIIEGKYHTPLIDTHMSEFIRIESEKFTDIIEEKLKSLNQSVIDLSQQRDDIISNALSEIDFFYQEIEDIKKKKNLSTTDKAIVRTKERRITDIKRRARKEVTDINKQGIANLGEANELVKNFNADFTEELSFCREKLTIYWDSLFSKCKKFNPDTEINGQLPTEDELIAMYKIKNPSLDFKIESYGIRSLDEFNETNG